MTEPIVVGVALRDDDDAPLALARNLARFTGAPLALDHINPSEPPSRLPYDLRPRIRAAEEQVRARVPEGLEVETTVSEGDAADLLAGASEGLDLLVCGSRGYGPLRTVLLGGVSGRLAHTAACPLLVLPRTPAPVTAEAGRAGAA